MNPTSLGSRWGIHRNYKRTVSIVPRSVISRARAARHRIGLRDSLTIEGVHRYLEQERGRPIVIQSMAGTGADRQICGLWIETEDTDYIFHAYAASELHRRQILLHEYSHILMHHNEQDMSDQAVTALFPDLDVGTVARALSRSSVTNVMEAEAEALADMLAMEMHRYAYRPDEPGNLGILGL